MNSNYNSLKWGIITQIFQFFQIKTYLNFPIIPGYKTESDNNLSYFVIALCNSL